MYPQISVLFTLQPVVFELQAILRQLHWITPVTLNTSRYSIPGVYVFWSPKFHSILLYKQLFFFVCLFCFVFWDAGHFEKSAPMTPKWPWTLQSQMYPMYILLLPRVTNFSPFHSMANRFWVAGYFEKRCTEWSQSNLEPYKIKCTPYVLLVPMSSKFHCFALWPAIFEKQTILITVKFESL